MTRRHVAGVIFAAWAVALGFLVKREYFRSTAAKLADAALSVPPGAEYYVLSIGGRPVGYASSTVDTLPDTIRVQDVRVIDVPALGRLHRTTTRTDARLSRTLRLVTADGTWEEDGVRSSVEAAVTPRGRLEYAIGAAGRRVTGAVPTERPVVVPSLFALRIAFGGELKPGDAHTALVLDPADLALRDVTARITAETTLIVPDSAAFDSTRGAWVPVLWDTVPSFRLEERGADGPRTVWIDAQGRLVRAVTPGGFAAERTAFEIAVNNFRRRDTLALARASADPPAGAIVPATAAAAGVQPDAPLRDRLRVVLAGAPASAFDADGGDQRVAGDSVTVTRATTDGLRPGFRLPDRDSAFAALTAPEPLWPAGDPRIGFPVVQRLGPERDPVRAAALLLHWTAAALRPAADPALPAALRVLGAPATDGDGAAALFVAVARTAGLPARPVAGLLYAGGRFYYHAWVEVWLGRWVSADPLYDQFPADASHLRLAAGMLARRAELAPRLGTLTVEVR